MLHKHSELGHNGTHVIVYNTVKNILQKGIMHHIWPDHNVYHIEMNGGVYCRTNQLSTRMMLKSVMFNYIMTNLNRNRGCKHNIPRKFQNDSLNNT